MYVLGVDAGGTKTHCAVADETGRILGEGFSGPSNYQTCGREQTARFLQEAVDAALEAAGCSLTEIKYGVFGMSGADGPDDFDILNPLVKRLMGEVPFEVMHDGWIGFRSAVDGSMGVVSICGTGAGHAGENRRGQHLTLRNLDYIAGNAGGGYELACQAMHYAFRSEEGTWEKTALEQEVPRLFGVSDLEEVCRIVKNQDIPSRELYELPRLVFSLAEKGDALCRQLISDMGYNEGKYAAAIIRRLEMESEKVPVVLIGSLFRTGCPYLIDSYMQAVREAAKDAYCIIPQAAPVTGAIRIALERIVPLKS